MDVTVVPNTICTLGRSLIDVIGSRSSSTFSRRIRVACQVSTVLCNGPGFPTATVVVTCCDQASPLKQKRKDRLIAAKGKAKDKSTTTSFMAGNTSVRTLKSGSKNKKVLLFVRK